MITSGSSAVARKDRAKESNWVVLYFPSDPGTCVIKRSLEIRREREVPGTVAWLWARARHDISIILSGWDHFNAE